MVGGVRADCWRVGEGVESGIGWVKGGGDGLRAGGDGWRVEGDGWRSGGRLLKGGRGRRVG